MDLVSKVNGTVDGTVDVGMNEGKPVMVGTRGAVSLDNYVGAAKVCFKRIQPI